MRGARWAAILIVALAACAPLERRSPGPDNGKEVWQPELRAEPEDFALSGRREIKVVFSLRNASRQLQRLDFPTEQHWEATLRGKDGRSLFLWSEDRSFAAVESVVVVNPGERLEFEAAVPTRDMVAGRVYTVEAMLPGRPETAASLTLQPR